MTLPDHIVLEMAATLESFDEGAYLSANPDVAEAVRAGLWASGREHFMAYGSGEARELRFSRDIEALRIVKMARVEPLLRLDLPHRRSGHKYDFLTEDLRVDTGIADTENVSGHHYDSIVISLISEFRDGLILDCGAGRRPTYYKNVMNYEIVDYDTTDVIGVGEILPFKDESFDGVISIAVLEHVRDPFRCASEIIRVLKPGGKLVCAVPFLQPIHAYPHHYYNMTYMGARALFERSLIIDDLPIIDACLPIHSLTWIVQSWAAGLSGDALESFLNLPLRELLRPASELTESDWVKQLPCEKNLELAHGTMLLAHKPR
ncbi:MAG: class I SAM-dependent methyltransferase [Acetobacteraceae bacterium]